MILAEPVGEHIPLNSVQFRNHQHQRVDIDDKSDDRQVPEKEKSFQNSKVHFPSHPLEMD